MFPSSVAAPSATRFAAPSPVLAQLDLNQPNAVRPTPGTPILYSTQYKQLTSHVPDIRQLDVQRFLNAVDRDRNGLITDIEIRSALKNPALDAAGKAYLEMAMRANARLALSSAAAPDFAGVAFSMPTAELARNMLNHQSMQRSPAGAAPSVWPDLRGIDPNHLVRQLDNDRDGRISVQDMIRGLDDARLSSAQKSYLQIWLRDYFGPQYLGVSDSNSLGISVHAADFAGALAALQRSQSAAP